MVLVPYKQVVRDLKMDLHGCTKNLFPFVNRTLNQYGFQAVVYCVRDNWVQFNVVAITDRQTVSRRRRGHHRRTDRR
jgi:hypothetical protein